MIYVHEQTNLVAGDDGPDNSKHLTLTSIKLPTLDEIRQQYQAGGSLGAMSIGGLGLAVPECTFSCMGPDPQLMSHFGLGQRLRRPYTCYGLVRDKRTGRSVEIKAIMEGRLGKVEGSDLQRGELASHDYMIDEIYHYQLWWDRKEKYYYDLFTSDWRVDGVSQNDDARNILRIAGTS